MNSGSWAGFGSNTYLRSPHMNDLGYARAVSERIAVVGAGANGAAVGADLTRAGLDVTLIEQWPPHVEAMRANGVRVEVQGPDGATEVETTPVRVHHLCEVAELRERFDAVMLLVKAYDTRWATELIVPLLADDGLIAGVQNGMTALEVASIAGEARTLGTVIEVSSTMYEPGIVHRHTARESSWFAVGSLSPATRGREEEFAAILRQSGTVAVVDDILAAKWMKLVSNASVLVPTAALGMPMADALAVPGMRDLMTRSGQEALDVGQALGHRILPIFGLKPEDVASPETVVSTMLDTLYVGFVRPGATTTVLQDWTKGRRSEAGDLNGTVVAEGAATGVPTPVNAAVLEVARRIEAGELRPGANNLALMLDLAGG
jgi:2-dehydropantoate 2-reductase